MNPERPEKCLSCGKADLILSEGPGRMVGPIARSIEGIHAPLPEDLRFWVCLDCNRRQLTPEIEEALYKVEDIYRTKKT